MRHLKTINKKLIKTIFLVLVALCLDVCGFGQYVNVTDFRKIKEPLFIDSWMKLDVPLGKFINYKDSTAALNDFKGKLIIFDFWFTHCTSCIAQFPKEDSLQKEFDNAIQFILVTFDSEKIVKNFFAKWQSKSGITLSFPMIVGDTILRKAFRHFYDPHYAWVLPDGQVVGQTAQQFVSKGNIEGLLSEWAKRKAFYEKAKAEKQEQLTDNSKTKSE